jgi:hypothetical protein
MHQSQDKNKYLVSTTTHGKPSMTRSTARFGRSGAGADDSQAQLLVNGESHQPSAVPGTGFSGTGVETPPFGSESGAGDAADAVVEPRPRGATSE